MQEELYPFDESLRTEEVKELYLDDTSELPPTDIVAYNELRSCADIVRMYKNGQLKIQPDFQRDLVWNRADQTRLIDSLIKQLPIPSMCISLDFNSNERLVIDGLQRISTIVSFLTEDEFVLSVLDDVDEKISGKSVSTIKQKQKSLYDRVENLTIPITVLRCDYSKKSHMDYLFTIFHRLNSGGSKLNNQEIRNCIYNGKFNSMLKKGVKYPNYIKLFDIKPDRSYRFAYEELNLRYFAFSEWLDKYNGKLAKFLNDYMYDKEKSKNPITLEALASIEEHFHDTIDTIYTIIFDSHVAEPLSKTIVEALLIGVGKNLDYIKELTHDEGYELLQKLKNDNLFSVDNLKEGLSQKGKVQARLHRAIEIFAGEE